MVCDYPFPQVAHHTESKFHLEEALSGVYDVSLLTSWESDGVARTRVAGSGGSFHGDVGEGALPDARDKGKSDDTTDTVHITSKYGRRFECRVPHPAVISDANADDAIAFDPVKVREPRRTDSLHYVHAHGLRLVATTISSPPCFRSMD